MSWSVAASMTALAVAAPVIAGVGTVARAQPAVPPLRSVFLPADDPPAGAPEADAGAGPGDGEGTGEGAGGSGGEAGSTEAPSPAEQLRRRAAAFARFRAPARASAEAVGAYANGCLLGGVALPPSGPGFEVLHLGRFRRFGHPALIAYIRRLAVAARRDGLGPILVGDLSQPRGGPSPYGHRSHQSGLDVDIGFTQQPFLRKRKPTAREREELQPPAVVDLKARKLTALYGAKVNRLIELAARDAAVDRVFVNPHVKEALCRKRWPRGADRSWLRVVRPWTYHHDHLHARLKCPLGSPSCEAQAAVAPGDGCDEVDRWIADEERRAREPPAPPPTEPRIPRPPPPLPPLPPACQALIAQEAASAATRPPKAVSTARNP